MLKGRIKNINSSKYIVDVNDKEYDCTLRGLFRKEKINPYVGDQVEINEETNQIVKIYPRINSLIRPNIANIDIALVVTSVKKPDLDLMLLDKLLVSIEYNNVTPVICFTKKDLLTDEELKSINKVKEYYHSIGYETLYNDELDKFLLLASDKVIVLCGQTGAGKSSFLNKLDNNLNLETNPISESLNRGIHTTRYVSLYKIKDFYIADTPGFSALDLKELSDLEIRDGFIEFSKYECKYRDCLHQNTDGCEVINNLGKNILESRYENYQKILKEKHEGSSKLFKK